MNARELIERLEDHIRHEDWNDALSSLNELRAALPEHPNSNVVCHAPGDRCPGCPHYWGKSDTCSYAKPKQPLANNEGLVSCVAEVIFRTEDKPPGPPEGPLSMYKGPRVKRYYARAREVLKEISNDLDSQHEQDRALLREVLDRFNRTCDEDPEACALECWYPKEGETEKDTLANRIRKHLEGDSDEA